MLTVYWACLIGGVLFAILAVLLGDLVGGSDHDIPHGDSHGFDHGLDFLKPAVIVSAIAAFGGAGILLSRYGSFSGSMALALAITAGVAMAVLIYFLYIRPMRNTENSVGYSMADLVGMVGEVVTPIPESGCGEVIVKVGASHTAQIAASFDHVGIASGAKVVIVQADRDMLYVTPLDIN